MENKNALMPSCIDYKEEIIKFTDDTFSSQLFIFKHSKSRREKRKNSERLLRRIFV